MTLRQKNIIIPITVVTLVCVFSMIINRTPISLVLMPLSIIAVTVYNISKRKSVLKLFLIGFLVAGIYLLLLCLLSYLAKNHTFFLFLLKFPFND